MSHLHELNGGHLIGGLWIQAPQPTFHALDATTGEALPGLFSEGGAGEVDRAVQAATEAWQSFRESDADTRATLLETIAKELEADAATICERASQESGLPAATRLKGELGRTTGQLRLFAAHVREGSYLDATIELAQPDRAPLPKPDIRRMQTPLGPVAVFGASNFPLAFGALGGDTASALAAGCPVVAKGHPGHPGTNELVAAAVLRALEALDLPVGVFGLVQGAGNAVGAALVQHPGIRAVGFTGSLKGGRALADLAAARPTPIPVYAEMGSLNPLVLLPGALAERHAAIAAGLAASIALGSGQFCTKPGLVLVLDHDPLLPRFLDALGHALGTGGAHQMLSARLRDGFRRGAEAVRGVAGVATPVVGGDDGYAAAKASLFVVDSTAWLAHPALHEEVFGPAALVVRCVDLVDMQRVLAAVSGSLTGSLHVGEADDLVDVQSIATALAAIAGRVVFNGYPTGVEVCHAMVHGGPYPATTAPGTTSVGTLAITRFTRPVAWQSAPEALLPADLRDANPRGIMRRVDGEWTREPLA